MRALTVEAFEFLRDLPQAEQHRCLITLGAEMTVAARASYRGADTPDAKHLIGFNEMQHRLYGFLRHDQSNDEWRIDDLIESLFEMARNYGVEGNFGWAVGYALRRWRR